MMDTAKHIIAKTVGQLWNLMHLHKFEMPKLWQ